MLLPLYQDFRKVYDKIYAKGTELTESKAYFSGNRFILRMSHLVLMNWYEFN
jgi:hypothetical protein